MSALSEHLLQFCFVHADLDSAASAMHDTLKRFGPVSNEVLYDFDAAKHFILPLKSFTTRFLVSEYCSWSLITSDMKGENSLVDGLAISRKLHVAGVAGSLLESSRQWHVFKDGDLLRSIVCYKDERGWVFHQDGAPMPQIEGDATYDQRIKKERLTPLMVAAFLKKMTDLNWPEPSIKIAKQKFVGLTRSTAEVQTPIIEFSDDDH